MNRLIQGIGEGLGDRDLRDIALHVGVNIGLEQRQGHGLAVHPRFDASAQIIGNDGQGAGPRQQPAQQADKTKGETIHEVILQGSEFHGRKLQLK